MSDPASFEDLAEPYRQRSAERSTPQRRAELRALFTQLERRQVEGAPRIGETAPDFTLREAGTGASVTLSERATYGPVVLSFYRGHWCPYCNLEARALQAIRDRILAVHGEIYLVGPETEENALELRRKTESAIPLLFDDDAEVCRSFGLAFELPRYFQNSYLEAGNDLPASNPEVGWTLPIPATFVIGPGRVIVARHVEADYTRRMEPLEVLSAAEGLALRYRNNS